MAKVFRNRKAGFWDGMLATFQADVEAQLKAMRHSFEREDLAAVGEALHALKGLCLTMGLSRMAEGCLALERSVSEGRVAAWAPAVRDLEVVLGHSLQAMRLITAGTARQDPA